MARRVVVLPAPLVPSSATILPSGTSREIPRENQDDVVVDDFEIFYGKQFDDTGLEG